jgi:hypothetical protein
MPIASAPTAAPATLPIAVVCRDGAQAHQQTWKQTLEHRTKLDPRCFQNGRWRVTPRDADGLYDGACAFLDVDARERRPVEHPAGWRVRVRHLG